MKKKHLSRLIAVLMITVLVFGMTACGGDPSQNDSGANTVTVSMNILYPEDAGKENAENISMNVSEEATVLQVLEAYCEQEGIAISSEDMSGSPYVTGINEVKAEGNSGWVYEINDEMVMEVPSKQTIKDGDKIVWKYTTW